MSRRHALVLLALVAPAAGCTRDAERVVHVIAEQAPGLRTNARVQYLGMDVGHVREVYFTTGGVRIDLALLQDVPIRQRDVVQISPTTPFGPQIVAILPGDSSAPLMRSSMVPHWHAAAIIAQPAATWRSVTRRLGLARADSSDAAATSARAAAGRTTPPR